MTGKMESVSIKPLIVALDDYAVVSDDTTLYGAIQALEESHDRFSQMEHVHGENRYKHRAVLVNDRDGNIIGKLTQYDIIKCLEPKYNEIGEDRRLSRFGITHSFMHEQMRLFDLWQRPLSSICRKAYTILVKDIMRPITPDQHISENAGINEAIHRFIISNKQLLLVKNGTKTTGVIRLTDIFVEVCLTIKSCKV